MIAGPIMIASGSNSSYYDRFYYCYCADASEDAAVDGVATAAAAAAVMVIVVDDDDDDDICCY